MTASQGTDLLLQLDPFHQKSSTTTITTNNKPLQQHPYSRIQPQPNSFSSPANSMSTVQDDEDFKNIDRSSSFQTSTSSSNIDNSLIYNHNQFQNTKNNDNSYLVESSASTVTSKNTLNLNSIEFYNGPSLNRQNTHASYLRNSLIISPSLDSINDVSNDTTSLEVPTKKMSMVTSPSIQSLGDILNNKLNSKQVKEFNSISEEAEEEEEEEEQVGAGDYLNQLQQSEEAKQQPYNPFINQSKSTFYTAASTDTLDAADYSGFTQHAVAVTNNKNIPDLISLSSTIKSEPTPFKHSIDDYSNTYDYSKSYVVGDDNDNDNDNQYPTQMTPNMFSPSMVFNEPIQKYDVFNNESVSQSTIFSHHQQLQQIEELKNLKPPAISESSSLGQISSSFHEIGYDDSILVPISPPVPSSSSSSKQQDDVDFIKSHKPTYSMRLVRDSTFDDIKEEISPRINQNDLFASPPPMINNDSPSLNPFGTPKFSQSDNNILLKTSSPIKSPSPLSKDGLTIDKQLPQRPSSLSRSKSLPLPPSNEPALEVTQPEPERQPQTQTQPQPPTPTQPQTQTQTSTKNKRLTFKGLFKNQKKSEIPSTDSPKQPPATPKELERPSPALSQGSFGSRHFKSKSYSNFENITSEHEKQQQQQVKQSNRDSKLLKSKERKEKGRSLLSGWKRKSISFGQPLDEIDNNHEKDKKNNKKKLFGKSNSMSHLSPTIGKATDDSKIKVNVDETPKITVSNDKENTTPITTTQQKKPLLETYGFSNGSNTDQGITLSTPSQSHYEFSSNEISPAITSDDLLKTPTYNSPDAFRKTIYHEQDEVASYEPTTEEQQNQQKSNVVNTFEDSPFDNYEIHLDNLTPSPKKPASKSIFTTKTTTTSASASIPKFQSLAPSRISSSNLNDTNNHIAIGEQSPDYEREFQMLSLSPQKSLGSLSSSSKLHPGDALFPKHLAADEVASIVSLERSKSIRSSINGGGGGGAGTHARSGSIIEMINNSGNGNEYGELLTTSDGMVVFRSPTNSSFNLGSPISVGGGFNSKRSSILKNTSSPLSSPITIRSSNIGKSHSKRSLKISDVEKDLVDDDDDDLTDIYNMIKFGDDDGDDMSVINTDFNLSGIQFDEDTSSKLSSDDKDMVEPIIKPAQTTSSHPWKQNQFGGQLQSSNIEQVDEQEQIPPQQLNTASEQHTSSTKYQFNDDDLDSLHSATTEISQVQPSTTTNDIDEPRPISLSFKGLNGPTFNSSLKPTTRSAILGSIANSTGSHVSLPTPTPTYYDNANDDDDNYEDDDLSKDFDEYIDVDNNSMFDNSPVQPLTIVEEEHSTNIKKSRRQSIINRLNTKSKSTSPKLRPDSLPVTSTSTFETTKKSKPRTKSQGSFSKLSLFGSRGSINSNELLSGFQQQTEHRELVIKNNVRFSSRILLYDTYDEDEYDRHPESATCNNLTPQLALMIKNELNEFKSQMPIHEDSRCYTHFF
ncbi:hypothetical protein CANARDRAFT_20476 [[Candida] arabinofermentans NRRL YB-2248]|uniref:Bud neck involved protein n=1 Tax=[Candida] arabinofermentans NRRL YB-2248 TaxID=983967 RepID=A0A1E4T7L4_9ASCO|nr:hypothetical protein CANARDRAFT_20476 [[Candida] arabinofermentans NRRL YB-2248]